jgi:aspartyl-tRNA(Asn)/glutamyl-tRNA(Gln) amidotransferase subunit A
MSPDARSIARAVGKGSCSAHAVVSAALERIRRCDPRLNAFTAIFEETATADARALDLRIAAGGSPGPLSGVPFAVKNAFDVAGITTLAGSKIRRDAPPATSDADLVARFRAAGAILVGALNMDEFAYGFVTENAHYGPTHNPHDPSRIAGGSSGGSAAAVAAGLVPLALGSDTNGSVRVPAALCGVYGLKPTYDRLPCAGLYPFVPSLDHAGLFARSLDDLMLGFEVATAGDVTASSGSSRAGVLGGWFEAGASIEVLQAVEALGLALGADRDLRLDGADIARSAAFVLTACEGGQTHLDALRGRPHDFDPAVRDRLLAGALLPAAVGHEALRYQAVFAEAARRLFERYDVLLAPATPCTAPMIGEKTIVIDGRETPVRQNLGLYTQPISFIGLPVLTVPMNRPGRLPIGVQLIARWGDEGRLFEIARALESQGLIAAHAPMEFA